MDGEPLDPAQVIVTTGAQQALDIVYRTLLGPDDVAVTESPTFTGSLLAMRATGARVIGVPVDEHGLDVDALEAVLARHEVRLLSLQATCHNPTGVDLAPDRRERLMRLAVDRNMFVVEDRVYSDLRYEGERAAAAAHVRTGPRAGGQLAVQGRGRRACGSAGSTPAAPCSVASRR